MRKIVECVPNFSEGSDLALVESIINSVKSAKVIDIHSDPDHNRSVATILGGPEEVKQAAFELTRSAMQFLNVREHAGAHPFIGVVDVIPFVPVKNISVQETVQLAHEFGEKLFSELALPVYFYGEAAKRKERRELPEIRRGGYAALQREIGLPERMPDVGHGLHFIAGAVAVGVRDFLIAYNINLDTRELNIAKSIANNIREKNGGLPGVRALGVELKSKGITQVTINIVDYKKAPLKKVFDEVCKWAKEYQVEILNSELVGLVPKAAVFSNMREYLKLPAFSDDRILESHL